METVHFCTVHNREPAMKAANWIGAGVGGTIGAVTGWFSGGAVAKAAARRKEKAEAATTTTVTTPPTVATTSAS